MIFVARKFLRTIHRIVSTKLFLHLRAAYDLFQLLM